MTTEPVKHLTHLQVDVGGAELEVHVGGPDTPGTLTVCAAHPSDPFGPEALALFAELTHARIVCINPRGVGRSTPWASEQAVSLEIMVDDCETVRRALGVDKWVMLGLSGGGWIGQLYAKRYPDALSGLLLMSTCPCFCERLADPTCILSPFHPMWRAKLADAGLLGSAAEKDQSPEVATEWAELDGVGAVFRRRGGPALLVAPMPVSPEMRRAMPALWRFDARSWLAAVPTPTLVVCGTADPVVPIAHARALHEALFDSEFVGLEGAGHVPLTEHHAEISNAFNHFLHDRVTKR